MSLSRRQFLERGALGGALLVVGGVSLARWRGPTTHAPTLPLHVLDPLAFSVIAAAAEAILRPMSDVNPVVIAHRTDQTLRHTSPEQQRDIVQLAHALNSPLLGVVLDARPTPFLSLSVDRRQQALEQWGRSGLILRRSGFHAIRKLCCASYYADPTTWAGIGYAGPPLLVGATR